MRPILLLLTVVYCLVIKAQSVNVPTPAGGDNSFKAASTQYVQTELAAKANASHSHATGDITSGTFADARISASSVTQHQGSLALTQSQISNLISDLAAKAALASPAFTGTPTAPTAAFNTNTTQIATTAYVINATPIYVWVSGSNATTTGQSLTNITGLSVALIANTKYFFSANLSVQSSSTAGNQYGVNFSAAGATVEAQISGTLAAATSRSDRISAFNTASPAYVTSGATGGIRIEGIITTGANSGNLTIQHLKTTSGTSTVFQNSPLIVTRIQ